MENCPAFKTVIVDGQEFEVDCERFASQSSFFRNVLMNGYAEASQEKFQILEITDDVYKCVHRILAEGEIYFRYWYAGPVYAACRYLGVKDEVLEELVTFIKTNLCYMSESDVLDMLMYLWRHNDSTLVEDVLTFIAQNLRNFYEEEDFVDVPLKFIVDIISRANYAVVDEKILLQAISIWLAKEQSRDAHLERLLRTILPNWISLSDPIIIEWTYESIFSALEECVLRPKIEKPYKSWFIKSNEPLYVSKIKGRISLHHFDGNTWSELTNPMISTADTSHAHAARHNADLYIATPNDQEEKYSFMHYNFYSNKFTDLRELNYNAKNGIFWMNDMLYGCNGHIIQKYCPQYDLWMKPSQMKILHSSMFASNGKYLYTYAFADGTQRSKDTYQYDDRCRDWNRLTNITRKSDFYCGGFFNGDLYAADGLGVEKFDVRAAKWEYIMPLVRLPRTQSCFPKNLTQLKENIVVLDTYNDCFIGEVNTGKCVTFQPSTWFHSLNVVHSVA